MSYNNAQFTNILQIFGGMDINSTPDIVTKKGKAEYILNCYSHPQGGVARLFGRSKHNSTTIGATTAVKGIFDLDLESNRHFYAVAGTKIYKDAAGTWGDISGSVVINTSANNIVDFSKFQDKLIATTLWRDSPIEHDGGAGNASNISNMPAGKFNAVMKNRLFSFNTVAQPKLGYWSGINDRTSWDTTNDFLNFKGSESDDNSISGVAEHLESLILGKETSLFRSYHTGTVPAFKYYRISEKTGVAGNFTMQSLPPVGNHPARLVWMGKDNFYQLIGDTVTAIGDDIQPFFGSSERAPFQINLARLKYFTSGILASKNLYWCAFSSGSSATNNYCFILDYKNMMWALCDFPMNCFTTRRVGGRDFLYSGTYTGFVAKHDPAIHNNLGVAYNSEYRTSWLDWGDTQIEKKVRYLITLMDAIGSFKLAVSYRTNLDTAWTSLGNLTMETGTGTLGTDWVLGTSVLGGADSVESILELLKRFKRIQIKFTQTTINHYFRMYALAFLWSRVRGYRIG